MLNKLPDFVDVKFKYLDSLKLGASNYHLLDFLIEDSNDVRVFSEHFWIGSEKQFFAIMRFRRYKQNRKHIAFPVFVKIFKARPKTALEILFQHRVFDEDLKDLYAKGITLEELYEKHIKYPEYQLSSFIL